jgi:hypothetical protein
MIWTTVAFGSWNKLAKDGHPVTLEDIEKDLL